MQFLYAKHPHKCKHCQMEIKRGEVFCRTFKKNPDGRCFSFLYHYQCYIEYFTEWIRKQANYWILLQSSPKTLGRPIKSRSPVLYRKLKALQRYHKNKGNLIKVEEIEVKIRSLENEDLLKKSVKSSSERRIHDE